MALSFLSPLDRIQPDQILSQYSEWIYFTIVLVFFISISGITLRKHFDKPYVKPLIISVGLMLTFGVFKFKNQLTKIFEGWGIIGTIMLALMVAIIPYGLLRGFGMAGGKAFYLTYILFYILSWVQFSEIYHIMADKNLGLVNFGLLILFLFAVFKMVKARKSSKIIPEDLLNSTPLRPEIDNEIREESYEEEILEKKGEKITDIEIHSIEDIFGQLKEILIFVEKHKNNLPRDEREKILKLLSRISREEDVFNKGLRNLKELFKRIDVADIKHLQELKERISKVDGKERNIIGREIREIEEKLRIEKEILSFEDRLGQILKTFNNYIRSSVDQIKASPYPYDAKAHLTQAAAVLKEIMALLKEMKSLEEGLVSLTKSEKKLLKKERKTA